MNDLGMEFVVSDREFLHSQEYALRRMAMLKAEMRERVALAMFDEIDKSGSYVTCKTHWEEVPDFAVRGRKIRLHVELEKVMERRVERYVREPLSVADWWPPEPVKKPSLWQRLKSETKAMWDETKSKPVPRLRDFVCHQRIAAKCRGEHIAG